MSLGALGQYGSDSSISDSEGDNDENLRSVEGIDKNVSGCMDPLSLCGEQGSSDSDTDTSFHSSSPLPPPFPTSLLPLPDMETIVAKNASYSGSELHTSESSSKESNSHQSDGKLDNKSSVFSNPYERAEEAKMAMLKKHVREFDKKPATKGSSPPPSRRQYRKKRGGGNCLTPASVEAERNELFDENDSSLGAKKERKHRSGVTDSLQPPKKFMKMYDKIYTH